MERFPYVAYVQEAAQKVFRWCRASLPLGPFHVHLESGFELSAMGSYGHDFIKPTKLFGTACCPHLQSGVLQGSRRPWMEKLEVPLTAKVKARAKKSGQKRKMVVKKRKKDGSISVREPQCYKHAIERLRCGGPAMKASAIYPAKYGRTVARLHETFKELARESVGTLSCGFML